MGTNNITLDKEVAPSIYVQRQSRARTALEQVRLGALVLNAGPSLYYFTGLQFHLSERPVIFLLSPENRPILVIPELEMRKAESLTFPVDVISYGENPDTWKSIFKQAIDTVEEDGRALGVEPTRFRYLEYSLIIHANPRKKVESGEDVIASLRMVKDASEISAMREAVHIAQQAFVQLLAFIQVGRSEREIAAELTKVLLQNGSDPELPFAPIVSAGENSANPHAIPTDRKVCQGDLLVIDWGAAYHGYISDLTRTLAIGKVEPELITIAQIVGRANEVARNASRPGIPAQLIDQAARQEITVAGYEQFFTHRTGHGIGLEGHEPPYIRADNSLMLTPGMTFTVEPGIYLPNRGGVRIEDNILITETGAESLSDLPRQIINI